MRSFAILSLLLVGCGTAPRSLEGGSLSSSTPGEAAASQGGTAGTLTAGIWDDGLNFPLFATFRDGQQQPLVDFSAAEQEAARSITRAPTTALDLVLVIDTTGSMGDEIAWLQQEFRAIASDVATAHPGVPQRWALVRYRDQGDEYVVEHVDFTGDLPAFQQQLAALGAGGGGDFPEAPDQALQRAAQLSWSTGPDTARLVFWVADAPPHDERRAAFSQSVRSLRELGVHVYPVASSGIDERTEYAMRATAQLTLGRYVFITDDSGVGDSHLVPSIPCYVVTTLLHTVERAIDSELAGTRVEVDASQIIRTVGNPVDGQCALEGERTAFLF